MWTEKPGTCPNIYSEFGIERRDTAIFSSTGIHIMDGLVMIDVALQRKVF